MIRQTVGVAAEFFSVGICCLLVGTGVGLFQGLFEFGRRIVFAEGRAIAGGMYAFILGLLLYCLFRIRCKGLHFHVFCNIVGVTTLAGLGSGLVWGYLNWGDLADGAGLFTVLVTIGATIVYRRCEPGQSIKQPLYVIIAFAMVGSGLSFLQSVFSFPPREVPTVMAAAAGGFVSVLLGLFLYLKLFRKGFLFVPFCQIVSVAFLTGMAASLLLQVVAPGREIAGWISLMVPPFVALALSWHFRPRQTVATV